MDYHMSSPPSKKTRPITLHGKVLNLIDDSDEYLQDKHDAAHGAVAMASSATHKETLRMQMERTAISQQQQQEQTALERRRAAFSNLTIETQQFQKLVADLEGILQQSGESPEASWRARIIIRSTQEAEKDLWDKLSEYEQSPLTAGKPTVSGSSIDKDKDKDKDTEKSQRELRSAQTACMKLHRDFNRSHKVLVMILSLHQKRLKAQAQAIASGDLRTVRWSADDKDTYGNGTTTTFKSTTQELNKKEKDFSDFKVMREREREREADQERKNESIMRKKKVNEMYYEIGAASVDGQQSDPDDNVLDEAATVQSGEDDINCLFDRDHFCGAMNFSDITDDIGYDSTERDGEEKHASPFSPPNIRNSEAFHWYMPFEHIGEDMKSVHRDIVRMSKDIIQKGGKYTCESESTKS
jgi:hypothetical protein